jgi:hypothetical protein
MSKSEQNRVLVRPLRVLREASELVVDQAETPCRFLLPTPGYGSTRSALRKLYDKSG